MNDAVIELDRLTKVFLTDEVETHALEGIDLEIKRGEFVSISGPSGCGKSTLLSIVGLLDSPTGGSYHLNGTPVQDLSMVKSCSGYQSTGAFPQCAKFARRSLDLPETRRAD